VYGLMFTWDAFLYGKVRRLVVDGQTFPNTEGSCEYVEQARQCKFHVTMRPDRVTIVAVEKQ
jgi:hypothetical protein